VYEKAARRERRAMEGRAPGPVELRGSHERESIPLRCEL
jgi:hypothetical protein